VIVECPYFVLPLLRSCSGIDELIAEERLPGRDGAGSEAQPFPKFDVQIPQMSLPAALGTTLATIPDQAPYLFAEKARVTRWRDWLRREASISSTESAPASPPSGSGASQGSPVFTVGVAWQGNPNHRLDRYRSIKLAQLEPLAELSGIRLVSLQKGRGAAQLDEISRRFTVWKPPIVEEMTAEALLETAALMRALDLVVSVDTGTAHLAGALGVPVWVPLSAIGEWRWLLEREDSPWYPTLRLFRQRKLGNWKPVFRRMARELARLQQQRIRSVR
jgi:hypothetical protein